MVSYNSNEQGSTADPDDVAERLANQLDRTSDLSDDLVETVRASETPLAEPIGFPFSSHGSLRSAVRYTVLTAVKNIDEIVDISFENKRDDRAVSLTTHPSTLEPSNRLFHPASLAKLYQYGYWPDYWSVIQGGRVPDSVDTVAGEPYELRKMGLVWNDAHYQADFESDENWFSDAEAVSAFASRVTDDDVTWAQYLPWYRTTSVSKYRLTHAAQTTDWSEFPDRPDARPVIKDRFDTSRNPRVRNFVRMAVLRELERSLPTITNLSTGPDAWTTDRVSMVVTPTRGGELCPPVALKKLADYGYRPIDAWYDAPAVGYESDDPMVPRRFEFARGQALRDWFDTIRVQSPLFADAEMIREFGYLPGIDWQTLIPCVQSQIISNRQLHDLAQSSSEIS